MIRSFIAIELNDKDTIEKIMSFTSRLKQNQTKLKLVEPENLHITMKFLGNISESLALKIFKILDEEIYTVFFKGNTFEYKLKGAGQFNRFSVLWIKLIGNIPFLQNIKQQIEDLLFERFKTKREKFY